MKKLSILLILLLVPLVSAEDVLDAEGIAQIVIDVLCMVIDSLVLVSGAIAGLVFVIAGVKWVASQDDPGARKQAKSTMQAAVIGLIVIMVAGSIIYAMDPIFGFSCKVFKAGDGGGGSTASCSSKCQGAGHWGGMCKPNTGCGNPLGDDSDCSGADICCCYQYDCNGECTDNGYTSGYCGPTPCTQWGPHAECTGSDVCCCS